MDFVLLAVAALYFILSHLIAQYIGVHREMGYGKSLFYSILFTPVFGLIITFFAPKPPGGIESDH